MSKIPVPVYFPTGTRWILVLKQREDGSMPHEHDMARGNPHRYLYMKHEVIPELQEMGVSDATIDTLFIDNPRRFLSGE